MKRLHVYVGSERPQSVQRVVWRRMFADVLCGATADGGGIIEALSREQNRTECSIGRTRCSGH